MPEREPLISLPTHPFEPEPEITKQPMTWQTFKTKVGLRDDDPMSLYQDAQAQYFKNYVAPKFSSEEDAMTYFPDFMQRTARPQKYSPMGELFMQGATQAGKTFLQGAKAASVGMNALMMGLGGGERYEQAGRTAAELETGLEEALTSRQLEAQKRYAREVVPGIEEPIVHIVGDVVGSAPAFKAIGAIVPAWGAYKVSSIGNVTKVVPSYLTAAAQGAATVGAYNSMVAEPGTKLSEGVHGAIAGGILGAGSRFAEDVADKATAPFLNWLKWRTEPRTVRDITPDKPLRLGNNSEANLEMLEVLKKMTPDEKVQIWQEYENELGNLKSVPAKSTVLDRSLRAKGVTVYFSDGSQQNIPYGSKAEDFDNAAKDILQSGKLATHVDGTSVQLSKFYGAFGKAVAPQQVTTVVARNVDEAREAERQLRNLGLDVRSEGSQVIFQPSAAKKAAGVDVTTPLPQMPEVQLPVEEKPALSELDAAQLKLRDYRTSPEEAAELIQKYPTLDRRKETRLMNTAEGVEASLGVPVQQALEQGLAKEVEGGWELTRAGYEYGTKKVQEHQGAIGEIALPQVTPEQATEAAHLGTSLVEPVEQPSIRTEELQLTPEEYKASQEMIVQQKPLERAEGTFTEQELPQLPEGPKPGIVRHYETIKSQYDQGLIPKAQTAAVQATLRQLEQAIRTGLPDWAPILEPEQPKPLPKVFGVTPEETRAFSQNITVEGYNLTEQQKAQMAASQTTRESTLRGLGAYGTAGAAEQRELIEGAKELLNPNQQLMLEMTEGGVRVHSAAEEVMPEVAATPEAEADQKKLVAELQQGWLTGKQKAVHLPTGQTIVYTTEATLPKGIEGAHESMFGGALEKTVVSKEAKAPQETQLHEIGHILHSQMPELQKSVHNAIEDVSPGSFGSALLQEGPTGDPLRATWQHMTHNLMAQNPVYSDPKVINEEMLTRLFSAIKRTHTEAGRYELMELIKLDDDLAHILDLARTAGNWAFDQMQKGTSTVPWINGRLQTYFDKWGMSYLSGVKARTDPSWTLQRYGELLFGSHLIRVGPNGRWMSVDSDGNFQVYDTFRDLMLDGDKGFESTVSYPELTAALEKELKMHGWEQKEALSEGPTTQPTSGIIGPSFMARGLSRREFLRGKKEPVDVGITPVTAYFRNSRDWFNSVEEQTKLPVFSSIYLPLDSGQLQLEKFLGTEYPKLYNMLGSTSKEKRFAYRAWLMAKGADAKAEVSHKNNFSQDDLKNVAELRGTYDRLFKTFDIGESAPFLEDYVPRMEQAEFIKRAGNAAKAAEADPFKSNTALPKEIDYFAKHERVRDEFAEASTEQDAVLQLMQYTRIGAREKFLGPSWEAAKDTWRSLPPSLKKPVGKYMQHMYGAPDFTYQALSDWVDKWISKLPGAEKFGFDEGALRKFVLLQYSSSLGYRPALVVRDAMQAFLTAYPHLGARWFGHGFNKALTSEGWKLADKYGATIPKNVAPVPEAGEAIDVPGRLQQSLYFTHVGNNFGRVVAFNGVYDRAKLAIASFRKDKQLDDFLQDSGAEILQAGLARDVFVKAADPNIPIEDVAGLLGRYFTEATQWPVRKGNAPQLIRSQLGRMFGMYAQWPEQQVEYIIRGMSNGSVTHRMAWTTRWLGVNKVAQEFFDTLGADVSRWLWTAPAEYEGSPLTTAAQDLMKTWLVGGQGREGAAARNRLLQLPFQFMPGYQQGRHLLAALDSQNPLLELLGFRVKKETKFQAEQQAPVPNEQGFYSKLGNFLQTIPEKLPAQSLAAVLQSGVATKNELEATGILNWLKAQPKQVSKKDVLDFFKENQISFKEILKQREGTGLDEEAISQHQHQLDLLDVQIRDFVSNELKVDQEAPEARLNYEDLLWESVNSPKDISEVLDRKDVPHTPEQVKKLSELIEEYHSVNGRLSILHEQNVGGTRYGGGSLTLSGAEPNSYKELLMQLKQPKPPFEFQSSHWQEPNVLLHARFDTVNRGGDKTLRIEEIQSDWLQRGRETGFRQRGETPTSSVKEVKGGWQAFDEAGDLLWNEVFPTQEAAQQAVDRYDYTDQAPNAPYKETSDWLSLAARKMLRYAVENGYKRISWTTATQQSRRYGQEGMEGMEAAYDQMLPNIFRKLLGVKPEKKDAEELEGRSDDPHMWEVKIPEAIEKKVKEEGVPIASNVQAEAEMRIA